MRIESKEGVSVFEYKEGESHLLALLSSGAVKSVECVKAIQPVDVIKVHAFSRLVWSIFWFFIFMPMIIAVFFLTQTKRREFRDGQWNVTMKDGSRFIIHGNEQHILNFVQSQQQQGFLSN